MKTGDLFASGCAFPPIKYTIALMLRTSLFLFLAVGALAAQNQTAEKIKRGRYLAVEVGKCQDCHTPRAESGELDSSKWMKGAVLDFAPLKEVKGWHKTSPDLTPAGRLWNRWGRANLVKYLQTGLTPAGKPADPPMPAYKLEAEDAEAIVAYLETLR
jgi:mono/diheme cytochrome c family protein